VDGHLDLGSASSQIDGGRKLGDDVAYGSSVRTAKYLTGIVTNVESADAETVHRVAHPEIILHTSQTSIANIDTIKVAHQKHECDLGTVSHIY